MVSSPQLAGVGRRPLMTKLRHTRVAFPFSKGGGAECAHCATRARPPDQMFFLMFGPTTIVTWALKVIPHGDFVRPAWDTHAACYRLDDLSTFRYSGASSPPCY